jgi:GntR family transcriptional regulator
VTVNPGDPTPAYMQIANTLRGRIARGELRDGDKLPTLNELIDESGSALGTVRQAVNQLEAEGLVVTRQGKGTFVRHPRRMRREGSTRHLSRRRPEGTPPMRTEADRQDFTQEQRVIAARTEAAPIQVAKLLGIDEGAAVLLRQFVLTLDGEPVQTASSYFPPELAEDPVLRAAAKVPGGTHVYLKRVLGLALAYAVEDLVARMPTPEETAALHLHPGTPVVDLVRTIHTADDQPVEVTVFACAGDRFEFRYRVPID